MTGLDLIPLIKSFGYCGIFAAILLENGIPILFFVPGDTLLLTAGFLASQGYLDIQLLVVGGFITAILGYMLGYKLGHETGRKIFSKEESRFIKHEHVQKTKLLYKKYGPISLLLARFLPLRACVCFVAGAISMPYGTFMLFNVIGALAWGVMLPLVGYYLGNMIPLDNLKMLAVIPLMGICCTIIFVPIALHMLRHRAKKDTPPDNNTDGL